MKNFVFALLSLVILFGINSCCTNIDCVGADEIRQINFYNFSENDLDTIFILSYEQKSNFSIKLDSSLIRPSNTGDFFTAYTDNRIDINLEFKIKLPSTGQVFTLNQFEVKKESCNTCFPYRPTIDFYDKLIAYAINGQKQIDNQINIYN